MPSVRLLPAKRDTLTSAKVVLACHEKELRRANEILRKASAYFAQAEVVL